jgi:signal transduction histidine kinase
LGEKDDLELRLAFLGFGEVERVALAGLAPFFEERADEFVAAFYRHLLAFEQTRDLLRDSEVKRRLLGKQREYLLSLATPSLDEAYVEERRRIGQTHERIGLAPRWYLGAYSVYFSLLTPIVCDAYRGDADRIGAALSALMRILMLDSQIAMEAYIERHQLELAYLNRELAAAGRDLARDLEDRQLELQRTTRRARAAEELASAATLVAGLAHEIGTPMGVIQGHAELLESVVADERGRWRLRTIREQIDRISHLIETLLNISRPREPVHAEVDLVGTIDTALSFLADKFRRNGVQVERRVEPVPTLRGDAEKLQQLFLNLFLNAVDAMKSRGGGTLSITLGPDGEHRVQVRVRDTGVGIAPGDLEHIFEPFFTTKAAGEGSGLGLVVARGIVRDHEGSMEVLSSRGQGTEFRISLPVPAPRPGAPSLLRG